MRLSTALSFFNTLVLVYLLPAISALTLTNFQQINGFSTACTNAYNTPLTDCSASDFAGQGCSAKCIGFLDDLTTTLLYACSGTSVYPNTLIGLFFHNEGVQTLCSNAGGNSSSSDGGDGSGQSGGQDGAYSTSVQSAVGEASASITSTSTSMTTSSSTPQAATTSTSSTPQAAATSSSSTPQAAATTSTTTIVPTTVIPEPTTTSVAVVGTTVTPESPSDASTSTSHTKSSTSSSSTSASTSNGNGGGTPLDIGSSACRDAAVSVWMFALLAGSAGAIWLL